MVTSWAQGQMERFRRGAKTTPSNSVAYLVAIAKEQIMPQAILFDLDETLTDRTQSIVQYAERFQGDFADHLVSTAVSTIAAALLTADVRGYRPREEVWRDFSQRLPWRTVPHVSHLRRHWETCFPLSIVARAGLEETLSALHALGIRLGIVTNGEVLFQEPKIRQLVIGRYLSTVVISEAVQVQKSPIHGFSCMRWPRSAVRPCTRGLWGIILSMMCWVRLLSASDRFG